MAERPAPSPRLISTGPTTILSTVVELLELRLLALATRIETGDETAWPDFLETATTYATVIAQLTPTRYGALLTTKEMAQKLNVSPKTLLARKRRQKITPAVQLGQRGRAAIRWRGDEAVR